MKKRSILSFSILVMFFILLVIIGANESMTVSQFYNEDFTLIGLSETDIVKKGWERIVDKPKDDIGMLHFKFERWKKGSAVLVAVFSNKIIKEFIIIDPEKQNVIGSINPNLTLLNVLRSLSKKEPLTPLCDIGSGVSINANLTCDGFIITWYDNYSGTFVFDASTLEQKNTYFLYRLVHGLL